MSNETPTARSPVQTSRERLTAIELVQMQPDSRELERINQLIAAAMSTWQLADRVKRISLPLYQYCAGDLDHMQFVLAKTREIAEIVGLAVVEAADATELSDHGALLLHGIYVDPRQHRKAVGSRLLEAVEAIAVAGDASGLLVRAQADAVPFFEARGYEKLPIADPTRDYPYRFWKSLRDDATGQHCAGDLAFR